MRPSAALWNQRDLQKCGGKVVTTEVVEVALPCPTCLGLRSRW